MEEVRSYWQVASISHFCTIFGKPFKLPSFEPEELEQAFILDIPPPPQPKATNNDISNNHHTTNRSSHVEQTDDHEERDESPDSPAPSDQSEDYQPPQGQIIIQPHQSPPRQQNDEQQELHLLVRLAIALLKPHFSTKITELNWELYLRRIVDTNWVELERHPSPFRIPLISQDGIELTKNLTFNELPLSDKIDLFFALCDYRFWCEDAADAVKDFTPEELRLECIGRDSHGYKYWYFSGTRLFKENSDLSQDIILRKKRILELEYKLIELEKNRIFRLQEEKRKAELERAKQLAAEAREARLVAKKQQEQETSKKRKHATPILPPRTGLRERRSSATSNNNDQGRNSSNRKSVKQSDTDHHDHQQTGASKTTRRSGKNSKHNGHNSDKADSPDLPRKPPEEECKDELERLAITREDRAEAWSIQCDSLEEWESFTASFEKTKSTNEKYLVSYLNTELLPKIRAIYARRAAEARKKEKELIMSLASTRRSSRITSRKAQEEEEERQAQIREAEMRKRKVEAESRLRAELEQEMKARKNKLVINGTNVSSTCSEDGDDNTGRYNLRQAQQPQQHQQPSSPSYDFDGIIHPDNLSIFYEALELVIDTVRISKHAWPFVDPVPDTVEGYYDLISEPMDLKKLRTKVEFREYKSLIELEKDFQLLVNNCERFNGPRNTYTKMVYKLWKSFKKNVRLYLQRDLSMDENETFVYPPQPKPEPVKEVKPEPIFESRSEAVLDPTPEPVMETILEPIQDPVPESLPCYKQEPPPDSKPEAMMESVSEPVVEMKPEPVRETEPKPVQEPPKLAPTLDFKPESVTEPELEIILDPEMEFILEPESESMLEPKMELILESTPEANSRC